MPPTVRHTPTFTYNDFVHAMTDKPWYFSIFLDRAMRIARNLGVRSDDQEDYAMEAIAHMYKILAQYNPSRSKFSSYFDTCVGNKIKDCNEARQSDIVFGADRSGRESVDGHSETFSDEYSERCLRQRSFADSMEDEFRKFIDTLKPDERLVLYASEFGKIIYDDKERDDYLSQNIGELPEGKSYSEVIASRTGRTAENVRQIAKRLKERAKIHVQERGFDYGSYSTYMGYMTTRPAEGKHDFTSLDWSALSGVQRLRLRMYLYEKAVADGIISEECSSCRKMEIIDEHNLLSRYQKELLQENASKPYSFGFKDGYTRYSSLDEILCTLGVKVVIEDKVERLHYNSFFDEAQEYWEGQRTKAGISGLELEAIEEKLKRIEEEKKNIAFFTYPLGEYSREEKKIYLYVGRMREIDSHRIIHYLISTFAHEVMHAYFDRPGCDHHPYAFFVEEPMAELGMLLYLNATRFDYLNWAIGEVHGKPTCYRYGWDLYQQFLDGYRGILYHLETYKTDVGRFDMLDVCNGIVSFPMPMDSNGLKIVYGENGCYGITDRSGKMVVSTDFDGITPEGSKYVAVLSGIEISLNDKGKIEL